MNSFESFRLDGGNNSSSDTSIDKIFVYGSLRPDLPDSNLLSIWKDVCEVEWKHAHVSNAFLYRSTKDDTAQAMCSSVQNKGLLAASHHHRPFVVGCLISCKNEKDEAAFVQRFSEIDLMRNAPLECKRIVADVAVWRGFVHACVLLQFPIVESLFGKNLEDENMDVTPLYVTFRLIDRSFRLTHVDGLVISNKNHITLSTKVLWRLVISRTSLDMFQLHECMRIK